MPQRAKTRCAGVSGQTKWRDGDDDDDDKGTHNGLRLSCRCTTIEPRGAVIYQDGSPTKKSGTPVLYSDTASGDDDDDNERP